MRLCLAGLSVLAYNPELIKQSKYNLESFYSFKDFELPFLKTSKMFLLDSGAYTFMANAKSTNFDEYLDRYITFINKHDVKYFFELDIDSVVGLEKVEQMRSILENGTKKKCIPVWHKSRGINKFKELCENYDYISIGGIVTKEIRKKEYQQMKTLVSYAKQKGVKVHGLGFTNTNFIDQIGFYSVDSTSWLSGQRFGTIHIFDGKKVIPKKTEYRTTSYKKVNVHNFTEWCKFQKYLESR